MGVRWAVEARRQGRGEEQEQEQWRQDEQEQMEQQQQKERRQEQEEQRREAEQGQNAGQEHSTQGKQVRFGEEEQLEETRAENADEPEVTGRLAEVRTGRGSAGLVRGGDERCWADESSRKGKGKGNGGKGEHEGKGGGFRRKGKERATEGEQQRNEEKEEILRLLGEWQEREASPIVRWAWADENREAESTKEEEKGESRYEEKAETQGMRWADCGDGEGRMEQVMLELVGLEIDEEEKGTERDEGRVKTTPKMTRFRDGKVYNKLATNEN